MKKILILVLALMTSLVSYADDFTYNYLVFTTEDGTEKSVAVENLKLTFVNGQMVVNHGGESQTYDLSGLSKMFFSENAVDGIVETIIDADAEVDVFTIPGVGIGRFKSVDDARQSLKRGVYVLKQGNKTSKIAIK